MEMAYAKNRIIILQLRSCRIALLGFQKDKLNQLEKEQ